MASTNAKVAEIIENQNIKADRYGMAAISYVFKAFGDNIRSKAYWPWSEKMDLPWEESLNYKQDLTMAIRLINAAYNRREEEIEAEKNNTTLGSDTDLLKTTLTTKEFKRMLDAARLSLGKSFKASDSIDDTTKSSNEKLDLIEKVKGNE